MCVIVVAGARVAAAAVVVERITPYDNQTYRLYLVIVAAKAAAAEAIIFVWGPGCHQCRNPNIQFKKMKKEETQNEENEKKAKIGGDKIRLVNLKGHIWLFGGSKNSNRTDRRPKNHHFEINQFHFFSTMISMIFSLFSIKRPDKHKS